MTHHAVTTAAGFLDSDLKRGDLEVRSPIDGALLGRLVPHSPANTEAMIHAGITAFRDWRKVPAPRRGEFVRLLGLALRAEQEALATLVATESGKIQAEALGEVQEMIDICDFAVGLSRQLYGLTMPSERPGHAMREVWQPMGLCGVITAFNFPVAVWAWNAALALVCGNSVIWKPSDKTPLTALAVQKIFDRVAADFPEAGVGLSQVVLGGAEIGATLAGHRDVAIVSATGSTAMGRAVGPVVAQRFGRCILELGGNNAMIVTDSADMDMTLRAIVFSAVGTAGQRCTSLRRIFVHERRYKPLIEGLRKIYADLSVGHPLQTGVLVGPLIDAQSYTNMQDALELARKQGGQVFGGERVLVDQFPDAYYVQPAIVELDEQTDLVRRETFAPILYAMPYADFPEAIALQNDVPQGLSSCVFTKDVREAELFVSAEGSDCGIANVNIGPSGAEIGGAFGGEKETGGGRESGSDAWKAYMRRQTVTVNYSDALPLAQGINFDI